MPKDIDEIKFMRKAFIPILPLVYDDALSYIEFLGKVCEKCNEIIEYVNNIQIEALAEAKAYTDEKIAEVNLSMEELSVDLNKRFTEMSDENNMFKDNVTETVNALINSVNSFYEVLGATTNAINARTDMVIEENNLQLLSQMQRYLANILVVNYITGAEMSVQDMFNYLCMFHLTDPITYTELAAKECTYTTLAGYNMTYTELVTNGGTIIV